MKKGVGFGVGSGSISQRYGSGDPDPHQNVTDPQHCLKTIRFGNKRKIAVMYCSTFPGFELRMRGS
jgi:hypothetical protein